MKKVRCENGHFYDADRFTQCPACGKPKGMLNTLKEGNNDLIDSEITVELPKSMHVDEIAPTVWINPDLFDIEEPESSTSIEHASPEGPLDPPFHGMDEPDVEDSDIANLIDCEPQDATPEHNGVAKNDPPAHEAIDLLPTVKKPENRAESLSRSCAEDGSKLAFDDQAAGKAPSNGYAVPSKPSGQVETLAQAVQASQATAIPAFSKPEKERNIKRAILPVGWLVSISGVNKGTLFACGVGKNRIGSRRDMDIVVLEEKSVGNDTHAIIIYEPKKRQFFIQSGSGNGLTYLNNELVFTHEELHAYDRITLGDAEFIFVPLCGNSFSWDEIITGR